ncbi:helix-hairpin-helix domain-containing protein [Micromonospora sp. LOL_024]|uniref:helix-hairpin-helix domain-containing protein n=1 Tax=Micromonospora sp. LOL_024 TaxID=3345412 RepID=UPI003A837936
MPKDEEAAVRQRLWRLMPGAATDWPTAPLPLHVRPDPAVASSLAPGRDPVSDPVRPADPADPAGLVAPIPAVGPVGLVGPARAADPTEIGSAEIESEQHVAETPSVSRLPGPGAFDPGRRGVRALAAVAVLVVLGAGIWTWRSRPQVEPVVAVTSAAVTPEPTGLVGDPSAVPAEPPTGELVVAVAGKVRRPGLVRLPSGSRVADAVDAAGGALPGVDVTMLNPARKVNDGELILVGVPAPPPPAGAPPVAAPGSDPGPGARVNLNTATSAQLETLPGIGPVLAQRIVGYRDQHGGFRTVGDLRQVSGIGDARYEQLKDLVTV